MAEQIIEGIARKRRRLSADGDDLSCSTKAKQPRTLAGSVSPPPLRRNVPGGSDKVEIKNIVKSPFQLTWIRDLPESSNVDALSLKDILGDPLISECWEFNYLHDLDFLMDAFDQDVKDLVKVHVVHGFWKQEDQSRQNLQLQASKYPNITLHAAYMPEMFGTHHSKMMILIRHDSTAQVIIHTANMIEFDWMNMCQGLWKSPLLPLIPEGTVLAESTKIGSGPRFKMDLLNYLSAYDSRRVVCRPLVLQLSNYDFSAIRAALVASVPGRHNSELDSATAWGWTGMANALESISIKSKKPEIIVQVSSVASLGASDTWLEKTMFKTLKAQKSSEISKPSFHIIFPTPDEIRRSLNGYRSGRAIHMKIESSTQQKQLQYLKPFLRHWAGDGPQHRASRLHEDMADPSRNNAITTASSTPVLDAGRKRAAPHIKTYVRFTDSTTSSIDWMLLTSANMSKQAWGEAPNSAGEVRICSYEIGVLVWPELFGQDAIMVPTFKTDKPPENDAEAKVIVGARMPYDLPLVPYAKDDLPWCATASYPEPDWQGLAYNV